MMLNLLLIVFLKNILIVSSQNASHLNQFCCEFFEANFIQTHPCCFTKSDLNSTDFDFDIDSTDQIGNNECCDSVLEDRNTLADDNITTPKLDINHTGFAFILPTFDTVRKASQGFYNLLKSTSDLDNVKFSNKLNLDKKNDDEIQKFRDEMQQLKIYFDEKLKNVTVNALKDVTTMSAPTVNSNRISNTDSQIYMLVICVLMIFLIFSVVVGLSIYNRQSSARISTYGVKRSLPKLPLAYEAPDYEYIEYNKDVSFGSTFPTQPTAPPAYQLGGNNSYSESDFKTQVSSIYKDVIDAKKLSDDDNDFYAQVVCNKEDADDSKDVGSSDLYAKV
ncbi:hypothetical protein ACKWTF_014152 [Chironomus riparius]